MATSGASLQVGRPFPHLFVPRNYFVKPAESCPGSIINYKKKRDTGYVRALNSVNTTNRNSRVHAFGGWSKVSGNVRTGKFAHFRCKCQQAENVKGLSMGDASETWFLENAKEMSTFNGQRSNILEFPSATEIKPADEISATNNNLLSGGTIPDSFLNASIDSIEDEAWDLLRKSVVYYCGSPVGTIAANDPTSSDALNYDQVFIRDFIPSGMAFLLKGEYDIVRNFILHTLQLQSWEKTMDCHSPGQGLMPASFKVRTVALDVDETVTEEVLDPDFGEAAIGRVAPVDSGIDALFCPL